MVCIGDMHGAHDRPLAGVDLNLLVVLDALLAERHVTRAARRVGLTQPAASHALARLRTLFGDPLLVRGPRGTLLATPRAEALAPVVRGALDAVAEAVRGEPGFEPASARRTFRIAASDHAELVLLPALMARLAREAPGVDLWIVTLGDDVPDALAAGRIDLALGVWPQRGWPAGIYQKALFDDRFRCVLRAGHPDARRRLTLARFCELSHLLIAPRGRPGSYVDDALAALGRRRRVALAVPHFLVAPPVIAASDMIATLASRIADAVATPLGLVTLPPPIEIPGFTTSMVWHERGQRDAGQRWLRAVVAAVVR